MKTLDVRTMIVMVACLNLLFCGLLALAGLHAGSIRGMRHWAVASFCAGLSLGLALLQERPSLGQNWVIVVGSVLLALALCLYWNGIKAFKEQRQLWLLSSIFIVLVFSQNLWFCIVKPDINARVIANSLAFGLINALCAKALLIRIEQPLRTAYWFTGSAFAIQGAMFFTRALKMIAFPDPNYWLYASALINPVSFFVGSVTQLCLTFGFVLMLNYRLAMHLQMLATHDQLTDALNRRSLEEKGTMFCSLFQRTGKTLSVMLLDIDYFKVVNDTYGHQTGDLVLKRLSEMVNATIRSADCFARYGGEEFCILLPSTSELEALALAERIRNAYAALVFEVNGQSFQSTLSIGVADSKSTGLQFDKLITAADKSLYYAKQHGRNQSVAASTLM